ncbi:MAG: mannose-6-phosphate isomerase, class I [Deltaproteobacteria bacterium]|nr:mannose-6-phosphate isomerase, class I [Deltaproteobacteria bacterium]
MDFTKPFKIIPRVQNFSWGCHSLDCYVAKLSGSTDRIQHYAELWYGAHPSLPSIALIDNNEHLLDTLIRKAGDQLLGENIISRFGQTLPFLFKVLSIGHPLSIQAHPDKKLAEQLHKKYPQHYPDNNHKPEMAIAITPCELLYGFRSAEEIKTNMQVVPELGDLLKSRLAEEIFSSTEEEVFIRIAYSTLLTTSPSAIREYSHRLYARLDRQETCSPEESWILKLKPLYIDGDVGLFCFYLHNLCNLLPGEAIFIEPNTPHAYLTGELLECMANSDNTIRAGLTNKFIDIETVTKNLLFKRNRPKILKALKNDGDHSFSIYRTPAEEFRVECLLNAASEVGNNQSLCLIFCLNGSCLIQSNEFETRISSGEALVIPSAITSYRIQGSNSLIYRISV